MNKVWTLRYGFYYGHHTIFGIYTSDYKANKAKKSLMEVTENEYDYYNVSCYILDDKVAR